LAQNFFRLNCHNRCLGPALSGTSPALGTARRRVADATRETEAAARKSQLKSANALPCLQSDLQK
jgi:hypothetical protein